LEDEAMHAISDEPSDSRVRRAAKRVGLAAVKSRRQLSLDNHGDYMLIDPQRNIVVAGERFELTAAAIVDYCAGLG
jgi:hypothetical protein